MTLKALELLIQCYILVQGSPLSVMRNFNQLKLIRGIVPDCMQNIHPICHIKELMIKKELLKNHEMPNENCDRFLLKQKPLKIDMLLESEDYLMANDNNEEKNSGKR